MVSLKDARYQVLKNLFGPLVAEVACPTEIVGESHIPSRGPALLVCNHRSVMDPYLFSARSRRVVNWVMAPFVSSIPVFGWLAQQAGAISIIKSSAGMGASPTDEPAEPSTAKSEALIEDMVRVLRQGRLVGIFPEGMAHFTEPVGTLDVHPFKGTFMRAVLAARIANLPVIPAAVYSRKETSLGEVKGSLLQLFDPGEKTFDQTSLHLVGYQEALIVIGRPMTFDAYYDRFELLPPGEEPPAQTKLIETLSHRVQHGVDQLLHRAAMLHAPTESEENP